MVQFIQTVPALIFGAISNAKFRFSVQIDAAKPYLVLFANSTASFGVLNDIATSTGPKISSLTIVSAVDTLVNKVGR